jgi:transcriptional regulator with PAS, ATPase and Fis domain
VNQLSYLPANSQGKFRSAERLLSVKALGASHKANRLAVLDRSIIGDSSAMLELKQTILSVATSSETVLITGESGTGKELIARAIHELSPRSAGPYVPFNCGALNESPLESELFGHVKGSFTGAATNKKGFFENANSGTIFLDEFAEMSLGMQQRLLRVLQEGTVRPVGRTDAEEIQIDTRVIVATNHDLKRDIAEGKFRQDLFYRVNILQIHSPALRDRKADIPALAKHFLRKYNRNASAAVSETIPVEVLASLQSYSWPGNVRELENIIKRLAVSATYEGGAIKGSLLQRVHELQEYLEVTPAVDDVSDGHYQVTRKANCISGKSNDSVRCRCGVDQLGEYRQLLKEAQGNLAAVARQLNIPRTTLRHRLIALRRKCSGQ